MSRPGNSTLVLLVFATVLWVGKVARAASTCAKSEKWCEHTVATFCQDNTCSSLRTEGECVPREKGCDEFWCGNRQCQRGWLISRDVCCVYYSTGNSPAYSCTTSEVSCPGNTANLTIRPTLASSEL